MLLKWIFDRLVALVGLLVLWPVLLIVAILVKLKMPGGPAFFVQKRVQHNGILFIWNRTWMMFLLLGLNFSYMQ